jgi:hypothetical protein
VNFIGEEEVSFFFFAHSWVESSLDQAFKGCPGFPMLNLTLTFDIIQNKKGCHWLRAMPFRV